MEPHGHPRHAFTVDLEEWYHGIELRPDEWPSDSRLEIGLDRLLALLDERRVSATFFVLGVVAERFPARIAEVASLGHEIACHGFAHEFIYKQSQAEFREDVKRARDVVASAAGAEPKGYRAPYFSIRRDSTWALDVLGEAGFAYDSSIFPVRNDRYGIPGSPRQPYDVGNGQTPLREIPITALSVLGANVPFSGGAYLRILPWGVQSALWRAAERRGIGVVSYIHPWELDPAHPRIPLRRRVAMTHYARLDVTESRLDRLLGSHSFGRMDEIVGIE